MMSPIESDETDAVRLRALHEGDEAAWVATRSEVHHDTLLIVRTKLQTFRRESRLSTWIHRIAVNTLLGQLRRRRGGIEEAPRSLHLQVRHDRVPSAS
jgi:DNA-directed RNA polymerase specialized sigma24 family protein